MDCFVAEFLIGRAKFALPVGSSHTGGDIHPFPCNLAVALPPNIGICVTASTPQGDQTSIAIPSTEIAARSPLSLRS